MGAFSEPRLEKKLFFDAQSQPQKLRILKLTPQNKRMLLRRQLYHSANASDGAVGTLPMKKVAHQGPP